MRSTDILEKLHNIDRECWLISRSISVLEWDQDTYLPENAVEERSEQLGLLGGISQDIKTNPEIGRLLSELGSSSENMSGDEKLPVLEQNFLKIMRRKYDQAIKLPRDFGCELAKARGLSQAAWIRAKQNNDFAAFLPHLKKMVDFSRQKAFHLGYEKEPYNGLLDYYEKGMSAEAISDVFIPLKNNLKSFLKKIKILPRPDTSFLKKVYNIENQDNFSRDLLKRLGFNSKRGRLDISAHPFTSTLGSDDVRITTRYLSQYVQSGIFATIHEAGHAFYEMGFPEEIRLSCLADGPSMGIHESQSRLWENVIGRSLPFWEGMFPVLRSYFPGALSSTTAEDFYRAINLVEPSLIRIEADEVSYSLHIILRFELEKEIISGTLDPAELPDAWRRKMNEYLGIEPDNDVQGVLQDVHWSTGAFGYFPSYALGNIYGLQFWEKLTSEIPNLSEQICRGNFSPIHSWLQDNIYIWGSRLDPPDLLKTVTGKGLSAEPFLGYIESKYKDIYK